MGKNAFAILVSLVVLIFTGWLIYLINITPQELSGYTLELSGLTEGESFLISPLSPSVDSADVMISAESDKIFLFTGDPEMVAQEAKNGYFYESSVPSGQWQVLEGDDIDLEISSETALKITVQRGGDYHFWPTLLTAFAFIIIWVLLLTLIYA